MRTLFHYFSIIIFLFGITLTPGWAWAREAHSSTVSRDISQVLPAFDAYVSQIFASRKDTGCAIAIVYRNRVVFMKTYGYKNVRTGEKINVDTIFQLGSVSKTFASTLTAILESKGYLSIDDPVRRYLPNFYLKNSYGDLRIRNILAHTSGVPRAGFNNMIERYATHQQLVAAVQRTPVKAMPGQYYDYHNVMFSLIGDVIAARTKHSYENVLNTYLLAPLGMRNTTTDYLSLITNPNRASPHVKTKRGFVPLSRYSRSYYAVAPAAAVTSSIRDMAIYLNLQLGGYPKVLSHEELNEIHEPQVVTRDILSSMSRYRDHVLNAYYGLGWRILNYNNEKIVFHGGWLKGFTNYIGLIPERDVGIVILHNAETNFSTKAALHFFDLFLGLPETQW